MATRLQSIEAFALALPGVSAAPHFHFGSWRVGGKPDKPGKIFVTLPPGGEVLHVFLPDEQRERIFTLHPDCTEKLFWGEKVCGVRVLLNKAAAADVKAWVKAAWAHNGGEKFVAKQGLAKQSGAAQSAAAKATPQPASKQTTKPTTKPATKRRR